MPCFDENDDECVRHFTPTVDTQKDDKERRRREVGFVVMDFTTSLFARLRTTVTAESGVWGWSPSDRTRTSATATTTATNAETDTAWLLDCAGAMEICEWQEFMVKVQDGKEKLCAASFERGIHTLLRRAVKLATQRDVTLHDDKHRNKVACIEFLCRQGGDWNFFLANEGKSIALLFVEYAAEENYPIFYDALWSGRVLLDAKARTNGATLRACIDEGGGELYPFASRAKFLFEKYARDRTRQCLGEAHERIIRGDVEHVEHWCERAIFYDVNSNVDALNFEFVPMGKASPTTLLHTACANSSCVESIQLLLHKFCVDPHGRHVNDKSAAAIACTYGFREALRLLLERGLNPDRAAFKNMTLRQFIASFAPSMEATLEQFEHGVVPPSVFTDALAPQPPRFAHSIVSEAVARVLAQSGRGNVEGKYVYVLRLEHSKFYVGASANVVTRVFHHMDANKNGTAWTKEHQPIGGMRYINGSVELVPACIDAIYPMLSPADEAWITLAYMERYGLENVRGGPWCSPIIAEHIKATIKAIIDGCSNVCYRCLESGHFANECDQLRAPQCSTTPSSPNSKRRIHY